MRKRRGDQENNKNQRYNPYDTEEFRINLDSSYDPIDGDDPEDIDYGGYNGGDGQNYYEDDNYIEEPDDYSSVSDETRIYGDIDDGTKIYGGYEPFQDETDDNNVADHLQTPPEPESEDNRKQKKKQNRQIMVVMYSILAIFVAMIGYFTYFDIIQRDTFINSSSNRRIAKLSDTVIRGSILASDGTVLAETLVDDEGNETRSYPYKNIFAHVVGTSEINKSGLEQSSEFELLTSSLNPLQQAYNQLRGEKNMGDSIVTTLDVGLQQAAYQALGSQDGVVIAIEPSTGKVLAMVSKPDYDPNTLEEDYESIISDTNSKVLLNQATYGQFAPGSIFKIITALAYMREYPDYENYAYQCGGAISLSSGAGHVNLSCYANTIHGYENFESSFANSCNASFANMGLSLNFDIWTDTAQDLLFNQSLPADFSCSRSSFELDDDMTEWEIGATAIGQGTTVVTPMHMAMVTSAIANGGVLMEPYLVDGVQNADGAGVSIHNPSSSGTMMTTEEASKLTEMMKSVITEGTGTALNNMGYEIAGKTGTAETESSGNNAWFVGFAPADDPQIAICVLVENAETSSSYVAVPIARQLFAEYLQ